MRNAKLSWLFALVILILLLIGAYGFFARPPFLWSIPWFRPEPLSDEEYLRRQSACLARQSDANALTEEIASLNQRVTEARLFYSPSYRACLATYLAIDPEAPNPGNYNRFFVYNLDRGRDFFILESSRPKTYEAYLKKIEELEAR